MSTSLRFLGCALFAASSVMLSAGPAAADGPMPSLPPPSPPPPAAATPAPATPAPPVVSSTTTSNAEVPAARDPDAAPPPRRGFQMALRPGIAVPLGSAQKNVSQSDVFGSQFAVAADLGVKLNENFFVGGYIGLGLGGVGGATADQCDAQKASCSAVSARIGAEVHYHIIPQGKINPWVGYGIGFESSGASQTVGISSVSTTRTGFELAHLMGGADFRISKDFGVGPVVDFSIGRYSKANVSGDLKSVGGSGDIPDGAWHEWLTLGARLTIFP
jgi:hypothetical protein